MKMTPIFTIIFFSKILISQSITSLEHTFFSRWPEFTVGDILSSIVHCESSTRKVADFRLKTRPVRVPLVKKFSHILAKTVLRNLPNQKVSFLLPLRVSRKPLVDCSTAF